MEEHEETGMDTTFIGILLVLFLVVAALAVDIWYMYVSEQDLQDAAESSALAGAEAIKQRIHAEIKYDPKRLDAVVTDQVQSSARNAAVSLAFGKHKDAALIEVANNNSNRLTTANDITVGFWNVSSHTYTPGGTPVNAMQVRTRRTAESEHVGLGAIGDFFAKLTDIQKMNYTPEAIAAFSPRATANIAVCIEACDSACTYPSICSIPERRMARDASVPDGNRYAYTSLMYHPSGANGLSDLICMEMPAQDVCGKQVLTILDTNNGALRDIESMMYNPNVDRANKEYDKATGKLIGWWVIAPVTDCPPARQGDHFEQHTVTRYALIRISKICVDGTSGCQQSGTAFKAPPSTCGGASGLYIDRISCVGCGTKALSKFPGLRPVLVK